MSKCIHNESISSMTTFLLTSLRTDGAGNSIDTITDGDVMTTRPRSRSVYGAHGFLRAQYTETHKYANAIEKTLGVSSSRY
jgi:hypothetical protein